MATVTNLKRILAVVLAGTLGLILVEICTVHNVPKDVNRVVRIFSGTSQEDDLATRRQKNKTEMARLERFLAERAVRVEGVDCKGVVEGKNESLEHANKTERQTPGRLENDTDILLAASSCGSFLKRYGFITDPLTNMEETFPLAFSILVYKEAAQVVFMLRAIYRPQNSYCIHADSKSPKLFHDAMMAVSRCLPGVFVASRSVNVRWGGFTVLEPEIVCMRDLWNYSKTWRYFINLTGQEFPIRTNYEMVKILRAYHGANDVHGFVGNDGFRSRWKRHLPAPHNITVYAGAVQVTVNREFVGFLLHNPVALDFLNWTSRTGHPDENYFATMNFNRQLRPPGGYKRNMSGMDRFKPYYTRLKNWVQTSGHRCPGKKVVRQLCIMSVLDVPWIVKQPHYYANKFYHSYSRIALGCLAEELFNRTRDQTLGRRDFDVSLYESSPYIKEKLTF